MNENLQNIKKPTLVIGNTIKGYGVKGAKEHFSGYHTLSSVSQKQLIRESLEEMKQILEHRKLDFSQVSNESKKMVALPKNKHVLEKNVESNIFEIRLEKSGINLEDAEDNYLKELKNKILILKNKPDFYFITPDLLRIDQAESIGFPGFANYMNIGIREQHAIAMSHGISIENPNARIYICYGDAFAYRSLDQINAAATGGSNLLIVAEPSGIFQGKNGKTHQSVGQPMGVMSIPEVNFYEPADSVDLYNVFSDILMENRGVNYVRLHHGIVNISRDSKDLKNKEAYFIHKSDRSPKLVIITTGFMAENAVEAAKMLEVEYNCPTNVINLVCPKKIGKHLPNLLINNAPILTLFNGDPSILKKYVSESILSDPYIPRPFFVESHGFIEGTSGSVDDLIKYYKFDSVGIKDIAVARVLKKI